ncbi:MAG: lytic transglycosylase domain-containing protein, partial [Clostridia bacterium]|nr:lytic transglycosylase domain-containing protein [Clostridia bacterium]
MPKRRKKKKKSIKRKAVLCIMSALLLLLLCIAAYFVNNYIERTSYRMPYKAEILEFSKKYELEPALVAAVMHCESGNQSDSVSIKGAIGLMQIMPETGEWIAHKLNIEEYSAEMLYDPRVNVEMGCWYLNFLKQRFNNNFTNFIAAYNAGHGKVEE